MVGPWRRRARRTCQYACFPTPKTTIFLTFRRRVRRREEARAVRKAVNSSALRNPKGLPSEPMRVRAPWGLVFVWIVGMSSYETFGEDGRWAVARVTTVGHRVVSICHVVRGQEGVSTFHTDSGRTGTWHEQCGISSARFDDRSLGLIDGACPIITRSSGILVESLSEGA